MNTKIKLSKEELLLVQNAGIILTKNNIIQKVINLFGELADEIRIESTKIDLPENVLLSSPKISKGENYKGLPYVILDFPRVFSLQDIFAIRTLFWWGNYFSVTLHLKGIYKELFAKKIKEKISLFTDKEISIFISSDEWLHEHNEQTYISLSRITEDGTDNIFQENEFLKLSTKIEFSDWENVEFLLMGAFKNILRLLE